MSVFGCPYCNSARSVLLGNVYCSNHGPGMDRLDNGTLYIRTRKLEETADHLSRLSVRCMLDGEQYYKAGGNDYLVRPENFLVINQGQTYRTQFTGREEQQMLMVAFNPTFARDVFHAVTTPAERMLHDPFDSSCSGPGFFEKTYPGDPVISAFFMELKRLVDDPDDDYKKHCDLDNIYRGVLERLILLHYGAVAKADSLAGTKRSVKRELYKRVMLAKDYADTHLAEALTVEGLSRIACLSSHHFARSFRSLVGYTPHQYIIARRIAIAQRLLISQDRTVSEICADVGFENCSSFIRLFRERTKLTPEVYRRQAG